MAELNWMTPHGTDSTQNEVVAVAVFATVDAQGERSSTGTMGVHEFVIARRRYNLLQGDLVMLPEWPRGSRRFITYTRAQFDQLYERMEKEYVQNTESGKKLLIEDIYGPKAQSKLLDRMREAYEAYNAWLAEPEQTKRMDADGVAPMDPEIWDQMAKICCPSTGITGLRADKLTIPESAEDRMLAAIRKADSEKAKAAAALEADAEQELRESHGDASCSIKGCVEYLRNAIDGLTVRDAERLAKAMRNHKWVTANLEEEEWAEVKNGKNPEARNLMMEAMLNYLDAHDEEVRA